MLVSVISFPEEESRMTAWDYIIARSYWIPGAYAATLSEKQNSFLRSLKNKGFKEGRTTKVGLYALSKSTTLESNKSRASIASFALTGPWALLPWLMPALTGGAKTRTRVPAE